MPRPRMTARQRRQVIECAQGCCESVYVKLILLPHYFSINYRLLPAVRVAASSIAIDLREPFLNANVGSSLLPTLLPVFL